MLAATLDAHAEGFPFNFDTELFQRFLEDIVKRSERHIFDVQNVVNPWNTRQRIADIQTLAFVFGANFDMIPMAHNGERFFVLF
ncbi:hypothetical protein D3C72_2385150 [compost metagenome]